MDKEETASELYRRLHPSLIYTMRKKVLDDLLLLMPGGVIWRDGSTWEPVVRRVGGSIYKLTFRRPDDIKKPSTAALTAAHEAGRRAGLEEARAAFPSEGIVPGVPVVLFADEVRARIAGLADRAAGEVTRG